MSTLASQLTELTQIYHLWKSHVVEALGGEPEGFQAATQYVKAFLETIAADLATEQKAVDSALASLATTRPRYAPAL